MWRLVWDEAYLSLEDQSAAGGGIEKLHTLLFEGGSNPLQCRFPRDRPARFDGRQCLAAQTRYVSKILLPHR